MTIAMLFLPSHEACAQDSLWHRMDAATALSLCPLKDSGETSLEALFQGGTAHRMQEAEKIRSLGFASEGFRRAGGLNLFGQFKYRQQSMKNIVLCDNWDARDGNPYKVGSAIPGNYTRQVFNFAVKASAPFAGDKWYGGIALNYMVGDHSRVNDPRSRAQVLTAELKPSVTFRASDILSVGASITVSYGKEKMNSLSSKAETLDKYKYYDLRGNSEFREAGIIGFIRRTPVHKYGAGMHYGLNLRSVKAVMWWDISHRREDVIGASKEAPGDYSATMITGGIALQYKRHHLDLDVSYRNGSATEYMQERRTTINDQGRVDIWWETLLELVRYKNKLFESKARWTWLGNGWNAGIALDANMEDSRYILPSSRVRTGHLIPSLAGNRTFLIGKMGLSVSASAGYAFSAGNILEENQAIEDDTVHRLVTLPDYALMSGNYARLSGEAMLRMPVRSIGDAIGFKVTIMSEIFEGGKGSRTVSAIGLVLFH